MCALYQPGGLFGPSMGSASSGYIVCPLSMPTGHIQCIMALVNWAMKDYAKLIPSAQILYQVKEQAI